MRPVMITTPKFPSKMRLLPRAVQPKRAARAFSVGGEGTEKPTQKAFTAWAVNLVDVGLKADWIRLKNRTNPDQMFGQVERAFKALFPDGENDRADGLRKMMEGLQQMMGEAGSPFSKTLFPGGDPLHGKPLESMLEQLRQLRQQAAAKFGDANSPEARKNRDDKVSMMGKVGMFLTLEALKAAVEDLFCRTAAEEKAIQAAQQKAFSPQGGLGVLLAGLMGNVKEELKNVHEKRSATLQQILPLLTPKMPAKATEGQHIEAVRAGVREAFGTEMALRQFLEEALVSRVSVRDNPEKSGPLSFLPGYIIPVEQFLAMATQSDGDMPLPPSVDSFSILIRRAAVILADKIFNGRDEGQIFEIPPGI